MKFFFLALVAVLSLNFLGCNRGPTPETRTGVTKTVNENTNLTKIENFGEEAIARLSKRVDLTEEQKASIREISAKFNFSEADANGRKTMVKQMMELIKRDVLTKEQLMKGGY